MFAFVVASWYAALVQTGPKNCDKYFTCHVGGQCQSKHCLVRAARVLGAKWFYVLWRVVARNASVSTNNGRLRWTCRFICSCLCRAERSLQCSHTAVLRYGWSRVFCVVGSSHSSPLGNLSIVHTYHARVIMLAHYLSDMKNQRV